VGTFLFILKKFIRRVMSFSAGHVSGEQPKINNKSLSPNHLTAREIEVLLSMVKRTTFLGEDIEPLYNLVIKLQNQYTEINK
jgi:hypothetical protein